METTKKLRKVVIGAGGIADRRTIPGMMLAQNAELVVVMDLNAEHTESIRQKYGAQRCRDREDAGRCGTENGSVLCPV